MSFWETALAALVGSFGVVVFAGLARFGWFIYKARFTAYGRLVARAGMDVERYLRESEQRETSEQAKTLWDIELHLPEGERRERNTSGAGQP